MSLTASVVESAICMLESMLRYTESPLVQCITRDCIASLSVMIPEPAQIHQRTIATLEEMLTSDVLDPDTRKAIGAQRDHAIRNKMAVMRHALLTPDQHTMTELLLSRVLRSCLDTAHFEESDERNTLTTLMQEISTFINSMNARAKRNASGQE